MGLKELMPRVLGPTADYAGEGLKNLAEKGVNNLVRVFQKAEEHGRNRFDPSTSVPPRVVKSILEEGYFCEDELEASYLGGVLASAKGPLSRDDRALSYLSVLSSLSSYQIRTHCILYTSIVNSGQLSNPNIRRYAIQTGYPGLGLTVSIREADYIQAMEFAENEVSDIIAQHSFVGLQMKGLSEGGLLVRGEAKLDPERFRYFYPTIFGIELFVWGLGFGILGAAGLLDPALPKSPIAHNIKPIRIELGHLGY
jgi:hypothetical protein